VREGDGPARGGEPPSPVASVVLIFDDDAGSAGGSEGARSIVSRRDADGGPPPPSPAARGRSLVVVVVVVVDGDGDGPSTDRSGGDPPVIARGPILPARY